MKRSRVTLVLIFLAMTITYLLIARRWNTIQEEDPGPIHSSRQLELHIAQRYPHYHVIPDPHVGNSFFLLAPDTPCSPLPTEREIPPEEWQGAIVVRELTFTWTDAQRYPHTVYHEPFTIRGDPVLVKMVLHLLKEKESQD